MNIDIGIKTKKDEHHCQHETDKTEAEKACKFHGFSFTFRAVVELTYECY